MTAAIARIFPAFLPATRPVSTPASAKKRVRQPVFIHDAIVPWQGETLLLAMLSNDMEELDETQP